MVVAGQMLVSWRHVRVTDQALPVYHAAGLPPAPAAFHTSFGRRLGALTICLFLSLRVSHSNQHLAIGCCDPQCLLLFFVAGLGPVPLCFVLRHVIGPDMYCCLRMNHQPTLSLLAWL